MIKLILFINIILLFFACFAQAKSRLSILGGLNLSNPSYSYDSTQVTNAGVVAKTGMLVGVTQEKYLSRKWTLEAGLFGFRKRYNLSATRSGTQTVSGNSYTAYRLPLLLRRRLFGPVSLGAGGYVSRIMSSTLAGMKTNDYGLEGSIRLNLFSKRKFGFILEARCAYGLADLATSSLETLNTRDYSAMAGLSISFGERAK